MSKLRNSLLGTALALTPLGAENAAAEPVNPQELTVVSRDSSIAERIMHVNCDIRGTYELPTNDENPYESIDYAERTIIGSTSNGEIVADYFQPLISTPGGYIRNAANPSKTYIGSPEIMRDFLPTDAGIRLGTSWWRVNNGQTNSFTNMHYSFSERPRSVIFATGEPHSEVGHYEFSGTFVHVRDILPFPTKVVANTSEFLVTVHSPEGRPQTIGTITRDYRNGPLAFPELAYNELVTLEPDTQVESCMGLNFETGHLRQDVFAVVCNIRTVEEEPQATFSSTSNPSSGLLIANPNLRTEVYIANDPRSVTTYSLEDFSALYWPENPLQGIDPETELGYNQSFILPDSNEITMFHNCTTQLCAPFHLYDPANQNCISTSANRPNPIHTPIPEPEPVDDPEPTTEFEPENPGTTFTVEMLEYSQPLQPSLIQHNIQSDILNIANLVQDETPIQVEEEHTTRATSRQDSSCSSTPTKSYSKFLLATLVGLFSRKKRKQA